MLGPRLLSGAAVILALVLGFVSRRRFGRSTVPLTLLALMAATGSMFHLNHWIARPLWLSDVYWRPLGLWEALLNHPLWMLWKDYAPGILAISAILWLILEIRKLSS